MQIFQRILLCVVLLFMLAGGAELVYDGQASHLAECREGMQTEQFISKICRTGKCTYEDYVLYVNSLNYYGMSSETEMTEYQKESDLEGKLYRYTVAWSEIREELVTKGEYCFREDSTIELRVKRSSRTEKTESYYYGIIGVKG